MFYLNEMGFFLQIKGFSLLSKKKAAEKLGVISGNPLDAISEKLGDFADVSTDVTKDVLADDHCVVHENAEGDDEGEQRDHVDGDIKPG